MQVMIGTDAAGEGINLQFCRLMVNYDLPWNPNRLEQRMGRIYRYGQTRDCFVFNMIYPDTREGEVLRRLMEKLERMRERLGDTVYDVVGTLLEGVHLEDLIMQAILKGEEPELERLLDVDIEQRLEAFRRTLEENALASHHIDLSAVQKDAADSLLRRLVPWDVERFTRLAVRTVGGQFSEDQRHPNVARLSVPKEFLKQHGLQSEAFGRGLRVAFEREAARQANAEFFAPGHPLLDALIDHFLQKSRPVMAVLVDEKQRDGTLWLYRTRLQDGRGEPALERLVALFHDRTSGETREVDPRMVWELDTLPQDVALPEDASSALQAASQETKQRVLERLSELQAEAQGRRERECAIKERWLRSSYEQLIRESQDKLFAYHRRQDAGEDMGVAIRQEEETLKTLIREQKERLEELGKEREILVLDPELEAVALILPKPPVVPVGAALAAKALAAKAFAATLNSGLKPPDSGLKPPDSGLKPPDLGLKPPDSGLKPPDSGLKPPDSGLKPLLRKPLPPEEEIRRWVEAAGMQAAMEYERQQGREPQDVSQKFLGYDILSRSPTETRYIEVKAFATTGNVELTPHEWQMAQRLQEAYWLYAVENALTEPRLHPIRNPTKHLWAQPVMGVVKLVIEKWKEDPR
jgi:hypothetical protein